MQNIKRISFLLLFVLLIIPQPASGQNLNKEQQNIWNDFISNLSSAEKDYCTGYINGLFKTCPGWSFENEKSLDRTEAVENISDQGDQSGLYKRIIPLAVWTNGNVAFVTYTCTENIISAGEMMKSKSWTDMLVRTGNNWSIVGFYSRNNIITMK